MYKICVGERYVSLPESLTVRNLLFLYCFCFQTPTISFGSKFAGQLSYSVLGLLYSSSFLVICECIICLMEVGMFV